MKTPIFFIPTMLAIFVSFLGALDGIIVRILSSDIHPFLIVFYRSIFGLIIIIPIFLKERDVFISSYRYLHLFRAFLKILALTSFFLAFKSVSLSDVVSISFITPFLIILGSIMFLKETPTKKHIIFSFIGFIGILIILKPGFSSIPDALYWALIGAILSACIQLILKKMSNKDKPNTLTVWNLLCTVPLAFIPALFFWTTLSLEMFILLTIQGLIGVLNMLFITKAMSMVDISYLAPYDFLRLPIISILAFMMFDEIPSASTLLGALIIFLSGFLISNLALNNKK
ncbi:DMT family transporter [Candidatus Levibacter sp. Uisw_134_01]|uniref:DMT family transporter n=1 Tax=Candidatus Levibacter sp. Uisw_134_01 TaxID=3230999 RepID=UPI003D4F5101